MKITRAKTLSVLLIVAAVFFSACTGSRVSGRIAGNGEGYHGAVKPRIFVRDDPTYRCTPTGAPSSSPSYRDALLLRFDGNGALAQVSSLGDQCSTAITDLPLQSVRISSDDKIVFQDTTYREQPPAPVDPGDTSAMTGYRFFPSGNPLNQRVDGLPVNASSSAWLQNCGTRNTFNINLAARYLIIDETSTPRLASTGWVYPSNLGPVWPLPMPDVANLAAAVDAPISIFARDTLRLYEILTPSFSADFKSFVGRNGGIWDVTQPGANGTLPPLGDFLGASPSGLPLLPMILRYDEIRSGHINHALRFTCDNIQWAYVAPAREIAGNSSDPTFPPMGMRVRLKASFDVSPYPPDVQVILTAVKEYGMVLSEHGMAYTITGADEPKLRDLLDSTLYTIRGAAADATSLEVVDTGPVQY